MSFSLRIRDHIATWDRPAVMGILNVTPDSFYAPSRKTDDEAVAERVRQIIDEGADFIDIGAYSTRPGAAEVSADEEIDRLGRAMAVLRREAGCHCVGRYISCLGCTRCGHRDGM